MTDAGADGPPAEVDAKATASIPPSDADATTTIATATAKKRRERRGMFGKVGALRGDATLDIGSRTEGPELVRG